MGCRNAKACELGEDGRESENFVDASRGEDSVAPSVVVHPTSQALIKDERADVPPEKADVPPEKVDRENETEPISPTSPELTNGHSSAMVIIRQESPAYSFQGELSPQSGSPRKENRNRSSTDSSEGLFKSSDFKSGDFPMVSGRQVTPAFGNDMDRQVSPMFGIEETRSESTMIDGMHVSTRYKSMPRFVSLGGDQHFGTFGDATIQRLIDQKNCRMIIPEDVVIKECDDTCMVQAQNGSVDKPIGFVVFCCTACRSNETPSDYTS